MVHPGTAASTCARTASTPTPPRLFSHRVIRAVSPNPHAAPPPTNYQPTPVEFHSTNENFALKTQLLSRSTNQHSSQSPLFVVDFVTPYQYFRFLGQTIFIPSLLRHTEDKMAAAAATTKNPRVLCLFDVDGTLTPARKVGVWLCTTVSLSGYVVTSGACSRCVKLVPEFHCSVFWLLFFF